MLNFLRLAKLLSSINSCVVDVFSYGKEIRRYFSASVNKFSNVVFVPGVEHFTSSLKIKMQIGCFRAWNVDSVVIETMIPSKSCRVPNSTGPQTSGTPKRSSTSQGPQGRWEWEESCPPDIGQDWDRGMRGAL